MFARVLLLKCFTHPSFRKAIEMPIPPALAARLAKRGLMKDASVQGFDPATGYLSDRHSMFFIFLWMLLLLSLFVRTVCFKKSDNQAKSTTRRGAGRVGGTSPSRLIVEEMGTSLAMGTRGGTWVRRRRRSLQSRMTPKQATRTGRADSLDRSFQNL